MTSFADGGIVHLRAGLKPCVCKRQAGRETLTTRHLPVALTPHATLKSLDHQQIRNPEIAERYVTRIHEVTNARKRRKLTNAGDYSVYDVESDMQYSSLFKG
jgi:hypothetical protein